MDGKKRKKLTIVKSLIEFVLGCIKQISDLLHLAALEAQLAFKTLITLAVLIFILSSVITVSWLSVLVMVFFALLSAGFSLLSASVVIVCINLAVIGLIGFVFYKIKPNLFFPGTREQLHHPQQHMELKHEKVTTED